MSEKRSAPTCRKCEGVHYGYQACGSTEAVRAERALVGSRQPVQLIEDPSRREAGRFHDRGNLRPWNSVNDSSLRNGGLTFSTHPMKKRGHVHGHPDWSNDG